MASTPANSPNSSASDVGKEHAVRPPSPPKSREEGVRVREREAANEEWSNEGGSHEKEP